MAGRVPDGELHAGEVRFKTLEQYREQMRLITRQGLVDIMLMSASSNYALTFGERLFADSHVTPAIRANGRDAWIGWPTSPRLEELYQAWFQAPDQPARQGIAHEMQAQTLRDVPYVMLAQVFLPTVVRREVSGVLPGFPKFWNIRKDG